ncbi:hypothetical protein LTR16_002078 [Cryomyces antarcticus]|uniref:Peptidase C45 hydrolase domain-containing protein n=1 Tax=Cryomyces antarcticus TaxID=329879 RepID=A0ABR0M852_9PEZI|nr:hypothetical protein LTR60_001408 [Cryomyces antarcticus]KAK5291728.1 hypothetical protein LTR16_002078 [Cryomyces antarcticus]
MNVRTEIAYGMFNDGCTALSWYTKESSFVAQNWDWQHEQKANLVALRIHQRPKPSIHMITEAGIIGKIGINSCGVGVLLNAISSPGLSYTSLPVHLALRAVLDSSSGPSAVQELKTARVAAACHIMIADAETGGTGLECSWKDMAEIEMGSQGTGTGSEGQGRGGLRGVVVHTNHFVREHATGIAEMLELPDSIARLARITALVRERLEKGEQPSAQALEEMLQDESGYPTSINRHETDSSTVATLFSVVMDLKTRKAIVKLGRPSEPEDVVVLDPEMRGDERGE